MGGVVPPLHCMPSWHAQGELNLSVCVPIIITGNQIPL